VESEGTRERSHLQSNAAIYLPEQALSDRNYGRVCVKIVYASAVYLEFVPVSYLHVRIDDRPMKSFLSEIEVNPLPIIGHGHYQPILYHGQHYVPNANVYRQQALVPDHAHYTMLPQINGKFDDKSCVDSNRVGTQIVQHVMEQDEIEQNSEDKSLERPNTGVSYCPQNIDYSQKFVDIGPSNLYPHLYNYRSDPNGIAVVNYTPNKQAYINPYVYNQFIYAQEDDDAEESDSSLDE